MAIEYTVTDLEGVDEALRPLYGENEGGGGYTLKVNGVVPKSQFDELSQKALDATTEAQRRRKTVERITGTLGLDNADGLDDKIAELMNGKGKATADQQAIIDQIKAEAKGENDTLRSQLTGLKMEGASSTLRAELLAAGFHPEITDDIASSAMGRVSLDDDGNLRIMKADKSGPLAGSGAGGMASFADLAKELAAAKPSFLVDKGKGGGGKPPASGGTGSTHGGDFGGDKAARIAAINTKFNLGG